MRPNPYLVALIIFAVIGILGGAITSGVAGAAYERANNVDVLAGTLEGSSYFMSSETESAAAWQATGIIAVQLGFVALIASLVLAGTDWRMRSTDDRGKLPEVSS